jgi:hypothetical protein
MENPNVQSHVIFSLVSLKERHVTASARHLRIELTCELSKEVEMETFKSRLQEPFPLDRSVVNSVISVMTASMRALEDENAQLKTRLAFAQAEAEQAKALHKFR